MIIDGGLTAGTTLFGGVWSSRHFRIVTIVPSAALVALLQWPTRLAFEITLAYLVE